MLLAVAAAAAALWLRLSGSESVVLTGTTSYTEGVAGTWQRVNPLYASTNEVDQDLTALVFSGLLRLGADGRVEPDLASELPEVSPDGRTYTFRVRSDARWHDGQPVTSADVAFTVAKLKDPDFKGDAELAEAWSSIEVDTPDLTTAVIRLKQPSAPFLARNATIGLLPSHRLGNLGGAALYEAQFNVQPIGTGPFKLVSIDSQEAVLAANDAYHFGKPQYDTMRIRFYGDYPSAVRALADGQIEGLLLRDTPTEAQLTELGRLKGKTIEQLQRSAYLALYLNNDQAAFFQDERVRRSISLAIDRRAIVNKVLQGAGTPSASAVPPGSWAYVAELDLATANLEQARGLLDDAGWKLEATTGVRTKDGEELRLTIRTDNDPVRVAIAGEVQRQLEQTGIRATVAATTFSVLRRDFLQERKYDAALAGFEQGPDPDPYFSWHSSQQGSAGLNLANFGDVVTDELIGKARTNSDPDVRMALYRQFQEKWDELAPSAILLYPRYIYVHPEGLEGFSAGVLFNGAQRFLDVQKWHS